MLFQKNVTDNEHENSTEVDKVDADNIKVNNLFKFYNNLI